MNKDRISGLGNARTLHNENSSRFVSNILLGQDENSNFYLILQGKYIEICFDFKGDPTGGTITNCKFYLPKSMLSYYLLTGNLKIFAIS